LAVATPDMERARRIKRLGSSMRATNRPQNTKRRSHRSRGDQSKLAGDIDRHLEAAKSRTDLSLKSSQR